MMNTTPRTYSWIDAPIDTTPEEAGFDSSRLARLQEIFERLHSEGKIQCAAYCLARDGKVFADSAYGPRHHDDDAPMLPSTWRQIASVTKVLTSIGILKLVEDGRILMEWPVSKVLPEFDTPTHGSITFQQLLTHTSGIVADPGSDGEANPDRSIWETVGRPDWLPLVVALPLRTAPGEAWRYSSVGFSILGEAISRVTGEPFVRWMAREVLAPAGLKDTFWDLEDRPLDSFSYISDENRQMLADRPEKLYSPFMAMGWCISTCRDMTRLGHLLASGGSLDGVRILGRKSVEAMTSFQVDVPAPHWGDNFKDWKYGLGLEPPRHTLVKPGSVWGHEGASRCAMWFDQECGLSMAWTLPTPLDWDPDFGWTPRAVVLSGLM